MKVNIFDARNKTTVAVNALMAGVFLASASFAAPPAQAAPAKTAQAALANATPLTAAETEAIRGQGLPAWAVKLAITTVRSRIGFAAAARLERLLTGERVPTYKEYQKAFGTQTALLLTLLPAPLKPKIAQ